MSADNWDICPDCWAEAEAEYLANLERAKDVPDDLRTFLSIPEPDQSEFPRTFREDYYIRGARDGVVKVDYSASCTVCGLRLSFEHEHPIEGIRP